MILELSMMAIVVSGGSHASPPPPATASQQDCKYSVRESSNTYVCYSAQQYAEKQIADQKTMDEENKRFWQNISNVIMWCINQWWQVILFLIGIIVLGISLISLQDYVERKRHPERFNEMGLRNDWWRYY